MHRIEENRKRSTSVSDGSHIVNGSRELLLFVAAQTILRFLFRWKFSLSLFCVWLLHQSAPALALSSSAHIFFVDTRHRDKKRSDPIDIRRKGIFIHREKMLFGRICVCVICLLLLFVFSCCASHQRPTYGIMTVHVPCSFGYGSVYAT